MDDLYEKTSGFRYIHAPEEWIEKALCSPRGYRPHRLKWIKTAAVLAACLAVAIAGLWFIRPAIRNMPGGESSLPNLPAIPLPTELYGSAAGVGELDDLESFLQNNILYGKWENITALPVYQNMEIDRTARINEIARELNTAILSLEEMDEFGVTTADTEQAFLEVGMYGNVRIVLKKDAGISDQRAVSEEEYRNLAKACLEDYAFLARFEDPECRLGTMNGAPYVTVTDAAEQECIVKYAQVFFDAGTGEVESIEIYPGHARVLGEYPLIVPEEALERLKEGQYFHPFSRSFAELNGDYKVVAYDVRYVMSTQWPYIQPFYCIIVESDALEPNERIGFYVQAIQDPFVVGAASPSV